MKENIRYSSDGETLKIVILPHLKTIIKVGFGLQGIVYLIVGIAMLIISMNSTSNTLVLNLILFILSIPLFWIASTFFKKIWSVEIIVVTKTELTMMSKFFFSRKKGLIN
jgi:hypothetical protein